MCPLSSLFYIFVYGLFTECEASSNLYKIVREFLSPLYTPDLALNHGLAVFIVDEGQDYRLKKRTLKPAV